MERVKLTKEQAISLLGNRECIHTFRNTWRILAGADRSREGLIEAFDNAISLEIAGEQARAMGHWLVIIQWDTQDTCVFVEVDDDELENFDVSNDTIAISE